MILKKIRERELPRYEKWKGQVKMTRRSKQERRRTNKECKFRRRQTTERYDVRQQDVTKPTNARTWNAAVILTLQPTTLSSAKGNDDVLKISQAPLPTTTPRGYDVTTFRKRRHKSNSAQVATERTVRMVNYTCRYNEQLRS